MKRFGSPPMIMILDVLFAMLFIFSMEQSPNLNIILPAKTWVEDALVTSIDGNKKIQHWYNRQSNSWEMLDTFPKEQRKFSFLIGNIECDQYLFCANMQSPHNETKKIYIRGDLYDELSGMISDSCLKFPKECSNITYHIKKDGTVDRESLTRDHHIFRYILKQIPKDRP